MKYLYPCTGKISAAGFGEYLEENIKESRRNINLFARELSARFDIPYISLVNSGSSANLAASLAMAEKLRKAGKPLVAAISAFTFPTTVSSLLLAGFRIKMIDVEQNGFNMDPEKLEESIEGVSLIVPTHFLGFPAGMERISETAKKHGCLISFDPNLREPLWNSLEEAREQIGFGLSRCDVLKISDNELQWFTGAEDFDEGVSILQERYGIRLILLSKGRDGSSAYYRGMRVDALPFLQENTIETTGAGDTFCACALHFLLDADLDDLRREELEKMLTFANAAASLITTRKGALRVMPTREETEALIASRDRKALAF